MSVSTTGLIVLVLSTVGDIGQALALLQSSSELVECRLNGVASDSLIDMLLLEPRAPMRTSPKHSTLELEPH